MISLYDIAFDYIEKFYKIEPVAKVKGEVINQIKIALDNGWTSSEIINTLNKYNPESGVPNLSNTFAHYDGLDRNLLKSSEFYYHNLLRVCPPPPTQVWDINTGDIKTISEPFYLEMRASITSSEITDYYIEQMKLNPIQINRNRFIGSMKYMVDKYGVDLVLFMIDTTANYISSADLQTPNSPVGITEYMGQAKELLNLKLSETRAAGDDRIVYRKRVLTFRGRNKEEVSNDGLLYQEYNYYS